MTDPRIEAAARAICEYAHHCEGESVQWYEITEALRDVARRYALIALAAADAVVAGTSPETITIPEVCNDRPIEV
jgi:hypothetical protein